ncbi:MAG: DnaJ C-terminal domain-containing protein [Zoogloea sp.]|uniref:DnaJ C-terminal domain-containing protein n=1 Tax=Zoogloea sp. TaxID=49181 RepID=UPI0026047C31|nr:DnaJ C-terminal domain-containing protein [Zoogloea sp.]MDD3325504.1 DnaJ C-terminal domain-containing protein [Zoogloea sp.]
MEFKDYYKIMGLARDATQDEVRRAYRQLARKYHPDVSKAPDAEARFKELGEAYAVLKDLEKRAAYDQLGSSWKAGQDFRPPPGAGGGFEFSSGGRDGGGAGDYSDFFEAIFGQHGDGGHHSRAGHHARGQDHHARVQIDLEDAYTGATRSITLQTPEVDVHGQIHVRKHTLSVAIPRGIRAGQHIRLAGQGMPGMGQGTAGDLYLEIEFRPHPLYRVEQRDVYFDLRIAPWEAALGTSVEVPTPSGAVELKIPAGAAAGRRLRLKGRGIPGSTPGDFYAVLQIVVPPADTESARVFYNGMAAQFKSFDPRSMPGA